MQRKRKRVRYCKLQIACFIIIWYVIFIYIQDRKQYKDDSKDYFFKLLAKSGIVSILFDGITAYTVNRFYVVPLWLNNILHMCFLLSLDNICFCDVSVSDGSNRVCSQEKKRQNHISASVCN